ncbi:3-deoxy-D-manno-octulosonic acid transferase [Luteibaculum oceani]|uniref:3-deoxy-D-manno-octulosonic acid transferase n=1 Tax=Luteibaculum oceani TaxID=1294296 RepID=A0A5C6VEU3_9FLAO|nr:glycosyltransferase N-terminal domain-containing protein [Luteibaculum oceani]TXC81698.1 hypothetical protein FRX97_04055 [Luteibaculum oceani]
MQILHHIAVCLYGFAIRLVSPFNSKARTWIHGRKNQFPKIAATAKQGNPAIFHCASLGEYEQAVPLIKEYHTAHPDTPIWVSFFSPSGFENAKLLPCITFKFYLPLDTTGNAKKLLKAVRPVVFVFVKYDIWPNLISILSKENIPFHLVAAHFKAKQIYFKPWGGYYRQTLRRFNSIGVQFKENLKLIDKIYEKPYHMGDTRFEQVLSTANTKWEDEYIAEFSKNSFTIIFGSCWEPELEILSNFVKNNPNHSFKFIIAPHRVDPEFIKYIQQKLGNVINIHSKQSDWESNLLLIDSIGILKYAYRYADFAFVGGGFRNKVHNILEPLAYGIPVATGPKHSDYPEVKSANHQGVHFEISNATEFSSLTSKKEELKQLKPFCTDWIIDNTGGAVKAMSRIAVLK